MSKPLCIDLFCGLGGWSEGFLAEGYECIGFDIERHDYGFGGYPGQLVLQDVLTLHGSQLRNAAVIVASPPCQKYSYMAMPWKRAKELAAWYRGCKCRTDELNALYDACFRIAREAGGVPLVVENVKGAQPWVGRAKWHYGSFYLWGDVPALMPRSGEIKGYGSTWFGVQNNGTLHDQRVCNPARGHSLKTGTKQHRSGPEWFDNGIAAHGSNTMARKAASAQIAKIPLPLSQHIAKVFKP